MKQLVGFIVLNLVLFGHAKGQWGAQIHGERHIFSALPASSSTEVGSDYFGLSVGMNYFFRLKNYRLEFLPGVGLSYESGKLPHNQSPTLDFKSTGPQVFSLINLYPFDFKNDCNCPTFKKEGNTLKKGLHLIINLAYQYNIRKYATEEQKLGQLYTGLGFGNDFGISEHLTLTPMLIYAIGHFDKHPETLAFPELSHEKITLGLRVLYNKNKGKKRRY
jgi:hypothetical protein